MSISCADVSVAGRSGNEANYSTDIAISVALENAS